MSTKDEIERCLSCRAVDLRVVSLRYWLNDAVPIILMFGKIVLKAGKDGLTESLDLVVCMCMVHRSC